MNSSVENNSNKLRLKPILGYSMLNFDPDLSTNKWTSQFKPQLIKLQRRDQANSDDHFRTCIKPCVDYAG